MMVNVVILEDQYAPEEYEIVGVCDDTHFKNIYAKAVRRHVGNPVLEYERHDREREAHSYIHVTRIEMNKTKE